MRVALSEHAPARLARGLDGRLRRSAGGVESRDRERAGCGVDSHIDPVLLEGYNLAATSVNALVERDEHFRIRRAAARRPRWTEALRQSPLTKGRSRRTHARSSSLRRTAEATLGTRAPYWPTGPLHVSPQEACQSHLVETSCMDLTTHDGGWPFRLLTGCW